MSKRFLSVCLMLIAVCFGSVVHAKPSLGASPYNPEETVYIDKRTSFAVGRIYNTGNETLMINAFYVQTACYGMNYTELLVDVNPETKMLAPNQTYKLHITVEPKVIAKYEGYIDVQPSLANKENGNPILPGTAFNFVVTTKNYTDSPLQIEKIETKRKSVNIPLLIFYVAIVSLIIGILFWRRGKRTKTNSKQKAIRLFVFFFLASLILCVPLVFADESSDGTASVAEAVPHYYFNFAFQDLDSNNVESIISWQLWNGSGNLGYSEGEATLSAGNYTLKTFYLNHQINQSTVDTAIYGNSTFTANLQMKKQLTQSRWVAFNNTVGSITVNSASDSKLNFTATGSGTFLMVVATPRNCSHITKAGVNQTGWSYSSTPSPHVYLNTTLSTWVFYHALSAAPFEIPEFSIPSIFQFWFEGDLFGFFQSLFANAFTSVDVFYTFVAFIISMAIYIRTRSLILLTILAFLILGSGLMLAIPLAAGLGVLLMIFGVAGLLHRLYSSKYT